MAYALRRMAGKSARSAHLVSLASVGTSVAGLMCRGSLTASPRDVIDSSRVSSTCRLILSDLLTGNRRVPHNSCLQDVSTLRGFEGGTLRKPCSFPAHGVGRSCAFASLGCTCVTRQRTDNLGLGNAIDCERPFLPAWANGPTGTFDCCGERTGTVGRTGADRAYVARGVREAPEVRRLRSR